MKTFSTEDNHILDIPISGKIFLEGKSGTGKTTASVNRYKKMILSGIPAENILILIPQRALAAPYYQAVQNPDFPAGGSSDILTLVGLGQRMISLFWPMIAQSAGFVKISQPPTFLTLETAQYFLSRLVKPFLEEGYFESIHIDQNRLCSQIIDNLNKAAVVGYDYLETSSRLKNAWNGDEARYVIYDQAQECATRFRIFCLENNLLDFSLQMDVFFRCLWPSLLCRSFLKKTYRHIIFDNVEEDVPVVHDFLQNWIPEFESALIIYDTDGGYRSFLGADPQSGYCLKEQCDQVINLSNSINTSDPIKSFAQIIDDSIHRKKFDSIPPLLNQAYSLVQHRFYPLMIDWVCQEAARLINIEKVSPDEIVILSPFLSDSLRFSINTRLNQLEIPNSSYRPSRSLREEPASRCLLTLSKLAHPSWKSYPNQTELRYAFMQSIEGMDLVRADLLARITYHENHPENGLSSFDRIQSEMQDRITYTIGDRFEILRKWLLDYQASPPAELDIFLSRLFGEILSQPGFGFHNNYESASITARLIESAQKFRWVLISSKNDTLVIGEEYIHMVEEGVIAAQYLQLEKSQDINSVLIAPAYTFLIGNIPVNYQFWLDVGSLGWWERLFQPLTHPYVLSRHWDPQRKWTDDIDFQSNTEHMSRLLNGLLARCKQHVYLCSAGVNEQGDEQRGPLLKVIQNLLRQFARLGVDQHV